MESNNWRKMTIQPSEQMLLLNLLKKYGVQVILDEIEHLKNKERLMH